MSSGERGRYSRTLTESSLADPAGVMHPKATGAGNQSTKSRKKINIFNIPRRQS